MKKIMYTVVLLLLVGSTITAKTWITDVKNNSSQNITIQSNDSSSKNRTQNAGRNGWIDHNTNPIILKPGEEERFNDFVVGWKQFDSKVSIITERGTYILQEDNNSVFLTSPGSSQRVEIFQRAGGDRTVRLTIGWDGSLDVMSFT